MNWTTLSHVSENGKGQYGIAAPSVEYNAAFPEYLRITDISDDGTLACNEKMSVADSRALSYMLKPNDIVFARTGASVGRNYFYDYRDGEFAFAGFLIKFSINPDKINPRWVKYYCQSKTYFKWIQSFNAGSTRGNINARTYETMPLPLPSREYQDKAVTLLDSIENMKRVKQQTNDYLAT